jgi:hypothetical protein
VTSLRSQPLSIQVQTGELMLPARDVDAVVSGARLWAQDLAQRAEKAHERVGDVELAAEAGLSVDRLTETLVGAPFGLREPALALSADDVRTLRKVLAEMVGYQRVELSPGLRQLMDEL